ncbi:MAG: UDP-3-O-[3-hydroxymyristoyl] N-acetylglucosamine deacetylase [Bdellovibrionaceae bacterium]|nr:UDP-3-O-[3-hydroxymyristoyl] N-acetylglucosamine deacetylase [Pseudobdellovibrionaceae bacterium]|tara:strand:+ start:147992 stop:148900 length:909 start_codon:yes stop_codon:yes gene_type:complete
MFLQRTLRKRVVVEGIGLHTGEPATLTFCPAPPDTGIYIVRKDMPGSPAISTRAEFVTATTNATTLGGESFSVSTVEHCLSALTAFRIDNLFIELSGPEIPIVDGSAKPFVDAILEAGMAEQEIPRKYVFIDEPVYVGNEEKYAYVKPYNGLRVTCTIEFPHPKIGHQTIDIDINEHTYTRKICSARTFGFIKDVEMLQSKGLIRGGSLDNAIVLDNQDILNPEGLRFADEFVRHKVLDALGDLVMLGRPMLGHLVLYKAGHDVMNTLVHKVLSSPESYRLIELGTEIPDTTAKGRHLWAFN